VVRQESGKFMIAGGFTQYDEVGRRQIARLHPDGSLDRDFMREVWVNNQVRAIAMQSDNRILIGGDFSSFQENQVNRIARMLPDGTVDLDFDPGAGANGRVNAILQQPDGKILIGGAFTSVDGVARNRIARLNADGSLDTGFNVGSGANNAVFDLALQPDGKIVVAGSFTSVNGQSRDRIARLNPDGSLDSGFDPKRGANSHNFKHCLATRWKNTGLGPISQIRQSKLGTYCQAELPMAALTAASIPEPGQTISSMPWCCKPMERLLSGEHSFTTTVFLCGIWPD
jgi:uncharacterized delta-60 repeat protein